jgi:hypothetical protein
LSVLSVVCCQVEVSATDWSLVQRSPTECGASLCVIKKPRKRGGWSPLLGCENTTTMGCNARKTNKQTNVGASCRYNICVKIMQLSENWNSCISVNVSNYVS